MPVHTLDSAVVQVLVSAASAAPSIHNSQPWRFRLDAPGRTLEVHAAPARGLPLTDPDSRALHVSVGAAVLNLRAAAAHLGWEPVVRLLPRPDAPTLLATVRLAGAPRAALTRRADLYRAIWRRRSCRLPFTPEPVPESVLAELAEATRPDGAELLLPGRAERAHLLALTAEAERRATGDLARRAETLAWVSGPGDGYGIPAYALGPQDASGRLPMRTFAGPQDGLVRERATFESDPRLILLATRSDDRTDWLRAGQALQHALLLLTLHGLRASMLHQALEWPDLRARMADRHTGRRVPQMLLRVGYGPAGFPTPRHRVDTLLDRPAASRPAADGPTAARSAAPRSGIPVR